MAAASGKAEWREKEEAFSLGRSCPHNLFLTGQVWERIISWTRTTHRKGDEYDNPRDLRYEGEEGWKR
jgi:hypothetical protein